MPSVAMRNITEEQRAKLLLLDVSVHQTGHNGQYFAYKKERDATMLGKILCDKDERPIYFRTVDETIDTIIHAQERGHVWS